MYRHLIDLSTERNENTGDVAYHAMLRVTPAGVRGCPLGRSPHSYEDAYRDLRKRVLAESKVDIGPLQTYDREAYARDCEAAMREPEPYRTVGLFGALGQLDGERIRVEAEARERAERIRRVWITRTVTERTMVEVEDARDLADAMELAILSLDSVEDGAWEVVGEADEVVDLVQTTTGEVLWQLDGEKE